MNLNITKSDFIKLKILKLLIDRKYHTPSEIAGSLGTNTKTVLSNCNFLKLLGIIEIDEKITKRTSYFIKLRDDYDISLLVDILNEFRKKVN